MENNNKYYVPSIEEFHVGFEFEQYAPGNESLYKNEYYLPNTFKPEDKNFVFNVFEKKIQKISVYNTENDEFLYDMINQNIVNYISFT